MGLINDRIRAIYDNAVSLELIGANEKALTKEQCLTVINELEGLGIAILGGDVVKLIKGKPKHTYDSWHYQPKVKNEVYSTSEVSESARKAREYVESYPINKHIEPILFVLVANTDLPFP
ncbi:MAG: hypothetical protein KDD53_05530 [Bdellovibrionales bacterium]|nr:hypothetical protein [Bdellovibrionales bacterium]